LAGALAVGASLSLFMANAGGAWDNSKKYIEKGGIPGHPKRSDAHKAAVIGDTVGDPFKDTSGPGVAILIKVMSVVSLLIAPLIASSASRCTRSRHGTIASPTALAPPYTTKNTALTAPTIKPIASRSPRAGHPQASLTSPTLCALSSLSFL
jgi:hypothetical protein